MNARLQIEAELARAETARAEGNEGMARVCARRAAGLAVGGGPRLSAVDRLRALAADGTVPGEVRQAAERLTARLRPDHTLPFEADPLEDARLIVRHFLPAQS